MYHVRVLKLYKIVAEVIGWGLEVYCILLLHAQLLERVKPKSGLYALFRL